MSKVTGFQVESGGVIYRSESGFQAYYPRVVKLSEKEFVCSFIASMELESPDIHPVIARSLDGGVTWTVQGPVDTAWSADPIPPYSEIGFVSLGRDGTLFCLGGHWLIDPQAPETPLIDPVTCGMRRNSMALRHSSDGGRTWTDPVFVPHGVEAPLELPTGVVALSNGGLLISFSTWKEWNGDCPLGHRILAIRSSDNGHTWSKPVDIFYDPTGTTGYWEGRVTELPDGKLFATCWAHDLASDEDVPNRFAISEDGGATWGPPASMPVSGQTGWPISLGGDLLLFAYNHRRDPVGVRGMIGRIADQGCEVIFDSAIFEPQVKTVSTISKDNYAVTDFQFGAPSVISLGSSRYMVLYWCVVQGRSGINWTTIETA